MRERFLPLQGRKVGLITNHTAITRDGRWIVDLLRDAPGVELVALFSPEHGLEGKLDEKVGDSTQGELKVHSLYGKTNRPTPEMLAGIDTLVFDIQDIGTRFYTYIATLGFAMEEAARHNLRMVVLDRPNPITGTRVFGPLNDRDGQFTAYHSIPLVHGMTVGELAQLFNTERKIGAELQIIKLEGWRRGMWFDETGLWWVNPSPNMRSLTEATLYPAVGLLEACKLSVGRGTDTPFERLGAPWLDGQALARCMNNRQLAGVRFVPFRFTPRSSKFEDQECSGVQVLLTDRTAFDPAATGLALACELERLHPEAFDLENVDRLLFNQAVLARLQSVTDGRAYATQEDGAIGEFLQTRTKYLLYP